MRIIIFTAIIFTVTLLSCKQTTNKVSNLSNEKQSLLTIDSLTTLIGENPDDATLYAQRSKLYAGKGEITNAVRDMIFANKIDSLNPEYYIVLSDLYLSLGKSEVVNDLLLKANRLIPDNKDILYRLGKLYFYIQDYKNAIKYLNKAIEQDDYFAEAWFTKGLVYSEINKKDVAIKSFQFATERNPDYYNAYIQLGLLYSEKQDSLALSYYDNALRIKPDSYDALYGKAIFYQNTGNVKQAEKNYRYILKNISDSLPEIYFNLGYINMVDLEDYKTAVSKFDSAIFIKPNYFQAVYNKAFCYEQLQYFEKAKYFYNQTLAINPDYNLAKEGLKRVNKD